MLLVHLLTSAYGISNIALYLAARVCLACLGVIESAARSRACTRAAKSNNVCRPRIIVSSVLQLPHWAAQCESAVFKLAVSGPALGLCVCLSVSFPPVTAPVMRTCAPYGTALHRAE